jgi:hypothetical protein
MLNNQLGVLTRVKSYARYSNSKHRSDHIYACPMRDISNTPVSILDEGIIVTNTSVTFPSNPGTNVEIGFWCEVCGQTHDLTFSHHEGQTFVATRPHRPAIGACHGA